MNKIVIIVENGVVVSVFSDTEQLSVKVIDLDSDVNISDDEVEVAIENLYEVY